MEIDFKWKDDKPPPRATDMQHGFEFCLSHLPDPRNLLPQVAAVHLSEDKFGLKIEGVGWSKDERKVITFCHPLVGSGVFSWDYFENPIRSQS